jgi:hypothetical protein
VEIQRLEVTKTDLENRIAEEVEASNFSFKLSLLEYFGEIFILLFFPLQAKGNEVLQTSLERRKKALHERRLALEQDVLFIFEILPFLFLLFS